MLKPFLIVGVGGSGGKTVRALRQTLELRLRQKGWTDSFPKAWQLIHIDTPIAQDGGEFPAPFLPTEDYLGLVAGNLKYAAVFSSIFAGGQVDPKLRPDMERQLPSPEDCTVDVTAGAGQYRAVGRTISISRMQAISKHVQQAWIKLTSGEALSQLGTLSEMLGSDRDGTLPEPTVIVVSSIAGGSGAGQYLDVTEAIKAIGKNAVWTEHLFSILYSPDVFHRIDNKAGVEPNAIAAIAEGMAGLWSGGVNDVTKSIYQNHGVIPSTQKKTNRVGPTFNYIVGRSNTAGVDFDDQTLTYKAVAQSLAKWMTDSKVQGSLSAYSIGNMENGWVNASEAPDHSLLKDTNEQFAPFSSLGFGRVGLGMERFAEYASDRLARSVVDTMLYTHIESDPFEKERKSSEWIAFNAELSILEFINDLGLDEESESQNQIIDGLRPWNTRDELTAEMSAYVGQEAAGGLNNKGEKLMSDWHSSITFAFDQKIESLLSREATSRNEIAREWTRNIQRTIQKEVARSVSQRGLPVTIELLRRVEQKVSSAATELLHERTNYLGWAGQLSAYVGQDLGQAVGQDMLRNDHPAVLEAIERTGHAYGWRAEADLREYAERMMRDLVINYLSPLRSALSEGYKDMLERVTGVDSALYGSWPKRDSEEVASRYLPAPNEKLLIDAADYPAEFSSLITRSVETGKRDNALRVCLDELLMGTLADLHIRSGQEWSLFATPIAWVPEERGARPDSTQSPRAAKFEFSDSPAVYKERALRWIEMPDSTFDKFVKQDLASYLDTNASNYQSRLTTFRERLTEALASSAPLVSLDTELLQEIHEGRVDDVQVTVSTIPFAVGSDIFDICKEIILKRYNNPTSPVFTNDWFDSGASRVQEIDIFTQLKKPVQPMVIDSLMKPLNAEWRMQAASSSTREGFLRWKRARSLSESIPASKNRQMSMLRGWYVAKTLSHLDSQLQDDSKGPKVSIWSGFGSTRHEFPYPLMSSEPIQGADLIGGVLLSLPLALMECNAVRRLAPVYPYHRLMQLDPDAKADGTQELRNWIQRGVQTDQYAPPVNADRAGTNAMSMEERRQAVLRYLDSQLEEAEEFYFNVDKYSDVRSYTLGWEIRHEIKQAIQSVKVSVESVRPEVSGV